MSTTSTSTKVFQEAGSVQVYDDGGGGTTRSVSVLDVLTGTATPVPMAASFEAAAGRDTVAILDDGSGKVWLRRADQVEGFDEAPPNLEISPAARSR